MSKKINLHSLTIQEVMIISAKIAIGIFPVIVAFKLATGLTISYIVNYIFQ